MKHIFCTPFVFLLFVAGAQAEEVPAVVELKGHTDVVVFALYSPDETKISTVSGDKTARIWDAKSGKELHKLEGHTDDVLDVDFSPDGKKIVTGGHDGLARIWDAESGEELYKSEGRHGKFFPDGKRIAISSDEDGNTRILDVESGKELQKLEGRFVHFFPSGKRFCSRSRILVVV